MIDMANTASKSGDELNKQPGDIRECQLFLTSQAPRLLNKLFFEKFLFKNLTLLHEHH